MRQPSGRAAVAIAVACLLATGCRGVSVRRVGLRSAPEGAYIPPGFPSGPLAHASACYREGLGAEGASIDIAARRYLDAIRLASPLAASSREARDLSNAALARFLRVTSGRHLRLDEAWRAAWNRGGFASPSPAKARAGPLRISTPSCSRATIASPGSTASNDPRASGCP